MLIKYKKTYLGINLDLVQKQNIDFDTLCEIVTLHKERLDLFNFLEDTKDKKLMRIIFIQLRRIEFELQILWGFPANEVMHRSYKWPHCRCPKMDNDDDYPHFQWKSIGCPLHGEDIS